VFEINFKLNIKVDSFVEQTKFTHVWVLPKT